ncbi:acyl carrier protein [Streptomyces atratus]|uniref:acyl carrier protein n=1 Tax=Streptomyces atratus TaxID=1893 RepID=UPI00225B16A3|nr:acyl carrier protein [Streptomyces atratus]MCX5339155.1 acyl carrier protein [Streptomyces atratus]
MSKLMTIDELRGILVSCAGGEEIAELHGDIADTSLTALGYDSLALMETAARLKVDHGVVIPDEQIIEVSTLGELLSLVNDRITV